MYRCVDRGATPGWAQAAVPAGRLPFRMRSCLRLALCRHYHAYVDMTMAMLAGNPKNETYRLASPALSFWKAA
jgi:hypothetical protein